MKRFRKALWKDFSGWFLIFRLSLSLLFVAWLVFQWFWMLFLLTRGDYGKVYITQIHFWCGEDYTVFRRPHLLVGCYIFCFPIGPWRWFDESMLECCEPLEVVKDKGISFGKVVCLAHSSGAKVEAFRTNQSTIDDFRKYVVKCSTSDNCHMISTYHREVFKQVSFTVIWHFVEFQYS